MLNTPSGKPASISSSPSRTADSGTFSDGFKTNVLPQVIAIGNIQSGTIAGKLNGVMPTQTPTGWRIVSQSTCRAMFGSDWPMIRLGMPQANSTTSMPRWTDARDFGERLAVLARDQAAPAPRRARRAARETGTSRGPARRPASRPRPAAPRRPPGRRDRRRRPCRTAPSAITLPGRRIEDRAGSRRSARFPAAADRAS